MAAAPAFFKYKDFLCAKAAACSCLWPFSHVIIALAAGNVSEGGQLRATLKNCILPTRVAFIDTRESLHDAQKPDRARTGVSVPSP